MAFANPTSPNLADFTTYIRDQGITTTYIPDNDPYLTYALSYAENVALQNDGYLAAIVYVMAVYHLATHRLIEIAPDQTGQTFFADSRAQYKLLQFQAGVIVSSSDESTSQSLSEADFLKGLTLSALDLLKTPWGRWYMEYAQQYGPTIVGVS